MTTFNEMFPSTYLSAADLAGKPMRVTISALDPAKMRDGATKWALSFQGQKKQVVLNVTNGKSLAKGFGRNSDSWIGKEISPASCPTIMPLYKSMN